MAMCAPLPDIRKKPVRADQVAAWLHQPGEAAEGAGSQILSARASAEGAIREFQCISSNLTSEQAKEAYIRLVAGRGFKKARSDREKSGKASSFPQTCDKVAIKKTEAV